MDAFKDYKAGDAGASGGGQEAAGGDEKPEPEKPQQHAPEDPQTEAAPKAQSSQPSGDAELEARQGWRQNLDRLITTAAQT